MGSALDWARDGRQWPNRVHSRFVEAGGIRWHVQDMGAGPTILLLHGTASTSHSFRHMAPLLARDFRVLVPDLPGHGFTGPAPSPTLPGMAASVGNLLESLGAEPAMIVGHSAGAAIALRMALDGPLHPRLIVGLGSALLPFPGAAAAIFPTVAKLLFANPLVPELFAAGARFGGSANGFLSRATGSTIDAEGMQIYSRLFRHSGHVAGALRMMAHWDLAPLSRDLPSVTSPLLLLHGARDVTVPPDVALQAAAKVPGATAEILPDLGHLLHEEAPARINTYMTDAYNALQKVPS